MRQDCAGPDRHDMMQRQEVEQDRRIGAGVKNQGAGFRDGPPGETYADGFVLCHRRARFNAVPAQCQQFSSRLKRHGERQTVSGHVAPYRLRQSIQVRDRLQRTAQLLRYEVFREGLHQIPLPEARADQLGFRQQRRRLVGNVLEWGRGASEPGPDRTQYPVPRLCHDTFSGCLSGRRAR
jgi:hypothetical protein